LEKNWKFLNEADFFENVKQIEYKDLIAQLKNSIQNKSFHFCKSQIDKGCIFKTFNL